MPIIKSGAKPTDGGHLIFTPQEKDIFLKNEPDAMPYIRPFIGAEEFVNGKYRYILNLDKVNPSIIRKMPHVMERLEQVRQMRSKSKKPATCKLALTPARFECGAIPDRPFLVFPLHTSETREYIPLAYVDPPVIASNATSILLDAEKWHFALLTSRMHMAWMREIGGRLESRYRYSIGLVYNPFPLPTLETKSKLLLEKLANNILLARASEFGSTLADLYESKVMPSDLRKAHTTLDTAVDKLYRSTPFASDRERVEHLLTLYEEMTAPLLALAQAKPKRKKAESPSQTP